MSIYSVEPKKTIMLIDDHDISLFVTQHQLIAAGIPSDNLLQPSGFSALEYLEENIRNNEKLPDLIILDINMPVINGWQFLEKIEAMQSKMAKKITIYILSSYGQTSEFDKWKNKGMVKKFFEKPLQPKDIIDIRNFVFKI